ncbi:MAG: hypothetical protein AB7S40_08940 [Bacteroidales bacterium]
MSKFWNAFFVLTALIVTMFVNSCVKFPDIPKPVDYGFTDYLYPFNEEVRGVSAVISIVPNGNLNTRDISVEIPFLKYNKSWLFTLTQDDCKHAAYSWTWAAINGYPLSNDYFYNFKNNWADDFPPDHFYLGKTLGSTDGAGNEVRFSFTTTLAPQESWMDDKTVVDKNNKYRFTMKSGLVWENVREILNYGNSIAFHNVKTDETNKDSIYINLFKAQDIVIEKLKGRGMKFLAEPDGNKKYIDAAMMFPDIKVLTAQNGQVVDLFPYIEVGPLDKVLIKRVFYQNDQEFKMINDVMDNLAQKTDMRKAINIGVHGVDNVWISNLVWLNDEYGKEGDDSMWFTSLEEYFEYYYYRKNSVIKVQQNQEKVVVSVNIPMEKFFFYPSLTLNIRGITLKDVASLSSSDEVTGLSYADFTDQNGETMLMVNIDCRKYLMEHAIHFIERYEKLGKEPHKRDALYFTSKLKESDAKRELLQRIK